MRKRKTVHYKAEQPKTRAAYRTCEYQVWNKETRRPCPCGAGNVLAIKGEGGGHIAYLCAEHAEFFLDAHDLRSEEEKALEAVDA